MTIKVTYNVTDVYMSQSVSPVYINVSYSDGGASGGGVWGSITGTLSNQTDLQTALDAKLDESTIDGGTEGQILSKASATDFDFAWINNYAKYLATNVRNQSGSTIGAFQVVYISGATGNKPLISLADADTEATSSKTYGVTATAIANNGTGDVVTAGELSGINTSAFNEGDLLWLSTTAGGVVTSPPAEPAHAVFIGYVVRSHPTLGVIDVAIANGYELNELHGVQITTPTDNQGLFYNATSTLWENKSITTALGYTPVPTTRNITINGVTYDLSADRTWTISTGISGSGAAGQVTYWTGASAVSGSNNLFWDNTNNRLTVGYAFSGTQQNFNVYSGALFQEAAGDDNKVYIGNNSSSSTGGRLLITPFRIKLNSSSGALTISADNINIGSSILLNTRNSDNGSVSINANNSDAFKIFGLTRNVAIQNGGTFTDNGQRLQVYGDTLLRGSGNTSATTALTVQNSSSVNLLRVLNDGQINLGSSASFPFIRTLAADFTQTPTGTKVLFGTQDSTTGAGSFIFGSNTLTHTSGNVTYVQLLRDFTTTSGTGSTTHLLLNGGINQTGGANGVTRGLYINPTLTAAADWRSIEWSNNTGWGLYGAGTAANLLGGSLRVDGVMAQGGTTAADINFYMRRSLSGSVYPAGIYMVGTVTSTSTSGATMFISDATTQAASFTLPKIEHFKARQTTFGAGSTVTNQYGFFAEGTLTGATNNYGFYGDIASGTGRWNLYMAGTANNYVAGNFSIGTTSVTNWLNIAASTTAKAHINLVAGSTPTAPANGDIWFDGTDIKMRIGGVTKTFTLV